MSKPWSTFDKFQLLRQEAGLTQIQFIALCNAYGIEISNATISRAIKVGKFSNHETSEMLRPLVLKLEDLVERAAPFKVSFEDADATKLVLDILDLGVDLQVGAPIKINNSNDSSTTIPAAK
jgi:hypothetical protein